MRDEPDRGFARAGESSGNDEDDGGNFSAPLTTLVMLPPMQSRTLYMRKEFVERQALKERIDEGIKEDEAWHQFQQIVDAPVIYAHPFDLPYVASEILVIQWYIPYMDLQHVLIVGA
ncbi:hypothetical protein FPV67DRAFT_1452060 [Lyophyllum atratum]|nr:hypothetical protein FPV67DRAFT_1452060 [Lyophyllum atratum]